MTWIGLCVALVLVAGLAEAGRADAPRVVALDPPAMGVRVIGGLLRQGDVRMRGVGRLRVEPATEVEVRDEPVAISDETIRNWVGGSPLKGVMSRRAHLRLWGCLKPGSVVVRSERGGGVTYKAGEDYALDEKWGAIARRPEGRIGEGATVYVSYVYGLERLDTVQVDASGQVSLRRGEDARACALPAGAERGKRALANVYVPYHTAAITQDLVYPIGPRVRPIISDDSHRFVGRTRAKLERGEAVSVVFLGDSVTVGGDAASQDKRFVDVVGTRLGRLYPDATVTVVNAGIGGTNSDLGLERLDKDVLAHKPDLVVIEFVNDMFWPPAKIEANYAELVRRIRAAGSEVIICTPHLMAPPWMEHFDAAAQALREAAQANGVGLADASQMWRGLKAQGLPYMTLLANRINHPDNRGHRLYADALTAFFR